MTAVLFITFKIAIHFYKRHKKAETKTKTRPEILENEEIAQLLKIAHNKNNKSTEIKRTKIYDILWLRLRTDDSIEVHTPSKTTPKIVLKLNLFLPTFDTNYSKEKPQLILTTYEPDYIRHFTIKARPEEIERIYQTINLYIPQS